MDFRFRRAILTGKAGAGLISIIDKNRGTTWAGRTALKIDPDFFNSLSGIDPSRVLFVTGTNGKSTLTALITHILESKGYKVLTNSGGANMTSGIASALVKGADMSGQISSDFCIFEVDERYLHEIRQYVPCDNLLVSNLEKDQAQRNGDPDFIYRKIAGVIDEYKMNVFLNGDEPRSCSLADHSDHTVFYAVERHSRAFRKDDTFVTLPCPHCRSRIRFAFHNNDGVGRFKCDKCGYTNNNGRDKADYILTNADFDKKTFVINDLTFPMPYDEPYMLYNYAAAVAVCKEFAGITEEESVAAIATFTVPEGRIVNIEYKGMNMKYYMFKQENPETLQNFINAAAADPEEKVIILGFGVVDTYDPHYINSFYAFECDYSQLAESNLRKILVVTDTSAYDAANCLIYGGVDPSIIEVIPTSDPEKILDAAIGCECGNIYLTVNMTTFKQIRKFAEKNR